MRKRLRLFSLLLLLDTILPASVAEESMKPNSANVKVLITGSPRKNDVIRWKITNQDDIAVFSVRLLFVGACM
jgi:hypothetical protein